MKTAACVLITRPGLVLCVGHHSDHNDFGLPGGKIEPGEMADAAAVRELSEETGLFLDKADLRILYRADDGEYETTTFYYPLPVRDGPYFGDVGPVDWKPWAVLLAGRYGDYCARLQGVFLDEPS